MALVAPFKGLHYNLAKVPSLTEVVTPPYDVIKPAERQVFAARNPYNMVNLILPQALPGDDRLQNRYTRAAALFRQWLQEEVLVRDPEPAFYYWETDFEIQGREHTRKGLAALVRLEPLSGGAIKPHEQTFSAAKADRLELFHRRARHARSRRGEGAARTTEYRYAVSLAEGIRSTVGVLYRRTSSPAITMSSSRL